MRQPLWITFEGRTYTLRRCHRVISQDPPLSEGPFYELDGVPFEDFGFLPDAAFLNGQGDVPSAMHRIAMR